MELYFDNIDNQIAQLIKNAKTSIRVTSAYYTSEKLTDELCHASENNIDVQLIVDTKFGEALNLFKKLVKANALVYIQTIPHAGNMATMHNKFCVIDGYILITGSFNWTNNGARNNEENIIVVKNRKLAQKALAKFNKLRNDARTNGFENNNEDRIKKCSEYDEYCDPSYKDEELPLFPKIEYFRSNDEYSCFQENESIIISWEIKDCDNYDIFLYEKYKEKEKVEKKGRKNFNHITKDTDFILEVSNGSGTTIVRVLHINIPVLANIEVSAPKFTIAVPPAVPFPTLPFFSNIDTVSSDDSVAPIVTALKSKVERLESITLQHFQLIYPINDPITSIQIPNLQKKVLVLTNELQPIKQELTNTKIKLTNAKQELTNAKQEVANVKKELQGLNNSLNKSKQDLSQSQNQNEQMQKEVQSNKKEIEKAKQSLNEAEVKIQVLTQQNLKNKTVSHFPVENLSLTEAKVAIKLLEEKNKNLENKLLFFKPLLIITIVLFTIITLILTLNK